MAAVSYTHLDVYKRQGDHRATARAIAAEAGIDTVFAEVPPTAKADLIADFVAANDWISFLARDPATRSNTSVCLSVKLDAEQVKKQAVCYGAVVGTAAGVGAAMGSGGVGLAGASTMGFTFGEALSR